MPTTPPTIPVLVIGYGNGLRSDDGVGPVAVEQIQRRLGNRVTAMSVQELTPELADPISKSEWVVFIDATHETPAGHVQCRELQAKWTTSHSMTHFIDPQRLLNMAKELYGQSPWAVAVTIGGEQWGMGESLSAKVRTAMEDVIKRVEGLVEVVEACHA